MKVRVRLFALYREALGKEELEVDLPEGATVSQLYERLFPATAAEKLPRRSTLFAINQTYRPPDTPLSEGDEVVFIPPVAGGVA